MSRRVRLTGGESIEQRAWRLSAAAWASAAAGVESRAAVLRYDVEMRQMWAAGYLAGAQERIR